MSRPKLSETVKAASNRWAQILPALGITIPANGRHGACPKCGGTDRFRFDDKNGRGTWFCSQCGNGDGLDLVQLVSGGDNKTAADAVASVLGLPEVQHPTTPPARKKPTKPKSAASSASPIANCGRPVRQAKAPI